MALFKQDVDLSGYALKNGSTANDFFVGPNPTNPSHAVSMAWVQGNYWNASQSDLRYASKNGSTANSFSVALNPTDPSHAVSMSWVQSIYYTAAQCNARYLVMPPTTTLTEGMMPTGYGQLAQLNNTSKGSGGAFSWWATGAGGEGGAIGINGDTCVIINPGDQGFLRIVDEDNPAALVATYGGGSSWSSGSDLKLKTNLVQKQVDIGALLELQAYTFEWISYLDEIVKCEEKLEQADGDERARLEKRLTRLHKKKNDYGFIAQDIQKFAPECVEEIDGILTVNWGKFNIFFQQALIDTIRLLDNKLELFTPRVTIDDLINSIDKFVEHEANRATNREVIVNHDGQSINFQNTSSLRKLLDEQILNLKLKIESLEITEEQAVFEYFDKDGLRLIPLPLSLLVTLSDKLKSIATSNFVLRKNEMIKSVEVIRDYTSTVEIECERLATFIANNSKTEITL